MRIEKKKKWLILKREEKNIIFEYNENNKSKEIKLFFLSLILFIYLFIFNNNYHNFHRIIEKKKKNKLYEFNNLKLCIN